MNAPSLLSGTSSPSRLLGATMRATLLCLALLVSALPAPAHAAGGKAKPSGEGEAALASFRAGEALYALGHFREALEKFETAYKLKPVQGLLFNIAQCHRQLGALKEARSAYRRFLDKDPDSRFATLAREKLDEVERALEAQASAQALAAAPPLVAAAPAKPEPARETATAQAAGRGGAAPARALEAPGDRPAAPDAGWARTGGIIGLAGGAGTLALALVAEGLNSSDSDATGIGAVAITLASASAAAAGFASSSVRGVEHSTPLRVAGWVLFGLAVGDAVILVATPDVHKPGGLITSVGALGFLGVGTLSLEALLSAGEAESAAARPQQGGARVSPALVPVRLADGSVGASLGVVGAF
jgi:tetratricopeptide (TPR) repeat protein